jgi:hypothetical protein
MYLRVIHICVHALIMWNFNFNLDTLAVLREVPKVVGGGKDVCIGGVMYGVEGEHNRRYRTQKIL